MTLGRQHCAHRHGKMNVGSARSKTPNMYGNTLRGNRESLDLPAEQIGQRDASGSLRTHAEDVRTQAVGWLHSTWEIPEQTWNDLGSGGDGGKATSQREDASEFHAPDTEPDDGYERDAGAPTMNRASSNRHDESSSPAARAGCGNPARPDPRGGRSAMTVPTATRRSRTPLRTARFIQAQSCSILMQLGV